MSNIYNEYRFKCRAITPIMCYGADGKTPELRAPSIKGQMRYWWRALQGHLPTKKCLELESLLFGGADSGDSDKGKKSLFSLRVVPLEIKHKNYDVLPHRKNKSGIEFDDWDNRVRNFSAAAISPQSTFDVIILSPKKIKPIEKFPYHKSTIIESNDLAIPKDYFKELFILYSILGGIGKRARRGFGNFIIEQTNNDRKQVLLEDDLLEKIKICSFNQKNYRKYEKKGLRKIVASDSLLKKKTQIPFLKAVAYSNEYKHYYKTSEYEKFIKEISTQTHVVKYRETTINRPKRDLVQKYENAIGKANSRFASPVIISGTYIYSEKEKEDKAELPKEGIYGSNDNVLAVKLKEALGSEKEPMNSKLITICSLMNKDGLDEDQKAQQIELIISMYYPKHK